MKILIIDDSSLSRRILRKILEKENHEVIEAKSGIEGIEKFYLEKPDIVFLDLTMGDLHGTDVLSKIRNIDQKAKVIVATADIQRATKEIVKELGACGFVNKPFDEKDVIETLNKALSGGEI